MPNSWGEQLWGLSTWGSGSSSGVNTEIGLDFKFTVNDVNIIITPRASNVFNQFDEFGLILGLDRLPGEKNGIYKQRLLDVFVGRANSTYLGMINGITRELGLEQFKPFRIRPRVSSNVFVGENPIVIFKGPFIELWRDKDGDVLEMEINRFDQGGIAYTIKELHDYINANSLYFVCDQLDTDHQFDRSMTILNQSNQSLITSEIIPHSNKFTLSKPGLDGGAIVLDSVFFNDDTSFLNRVASALLVLTSGDYYINPYTGDVTCFDVPNINTIVRYRYINYNSSFMKASPVILHAVNDTNFLRIMFDQILGDDGAYYSGLPTVYGSDKINELLSVFPLYYGK